MAVNSLEVSYVSLFRLSWLISLSHSRIGFVFHSFAFQFGKFLLICLEAHLALSNLLIWLSKAFFISVTGFLISSISF